MYQGMLRQSNVVLPAKHVALRVVVSHLTKASTAGFWRGQWHGHVGLTLNQLELEIRDITIAFMLPFESNTGWHGKRHCHAVLRAKGLSKCNCTAPARQDARKHERKSFVYVIHFRDAWIRRLIDNFSRRSYI